MMYNPPLLIPEMWKQDIMDGQPSQYRQEQSTLIRVEGHRAACTLVLGRYLLPAVAFGFAGDEYGALAAHVVALQAAGYVPRPAEPSTVGPAWWQELYKGLLGSLEAQGIYL